MSAPSGPCPTPKGYWYKVGSAQVPPRDGPWMWIDLTNAPPDWEIEARRLESLAKSSEDWAAPMSPWFWLPDLLRRRARREALEEARKWRAEAARIRSEQKATA